MAYICRNATPLDEGGRPSHTQTLSVGGHFGKESRVFRQTPVVMTTTCDTTNDKSTVRQQHHQHAAAEQVKRRRRDIEITGSLRSINSTALHSRGFYTAEGATAAAVAASAASVGAGAAVAASIADSGSPARYLYQLTGLT